MRASLGAAIVAGVIATGCSAELPVVDLNYTVHQALDWNNHSGYHFFSNIRFGATTTGKNRWLPPQPPEANRTLTNGTQNINDLDLQCPQAFPGWYASAEAQTMMLRAAMEWGNKKQYEDIIAGRVTSSRTADSSFSHADTPFPGESEDCLFLDVSVPHTVWDERDNAMAKRAPVLVWLFGEDNSYGSKQQNGHLYARTGLQEGLLRRSIMTANFSDDVEPTIVVSPNYRLGLFGFLGLDPMDMESRLEDYVMNAGLLDQRSAFEWVQKNIHLFGGDSDRVTVAGHHAAAGDIIFHITAIDNKKPAPFSQAILQSPMFTPRLSDDDFMSMGTASLLKETPSAKSMEGLHESPYQELWASNKNFSAEFDGGRYLLGPIVDGSDVSDLPGRLLRSGAFHKGVRLLIGSNVHDGFYINNPHSEPGSFATTMRRHLPAMTNDTAIETLTNLYPNDMSGRYKYTTEFGRASAFLTDTQLACNNLWLAEALPEQTYWYQWNGVPGDDFVGALGLYHEEPNGKGQTPLTAMQEYILSFVATGKPKADSLNHSMPLWGQDRQTTTFDLPTNSIVDAMELNEGNCEFWQEGPFIDPGNQ